ncbi:DUF397 domain-containing protein [Streptomyces gamaensis]|uniref:DUF397 domain-containing protein n=1 Tax=Streptomyces gamaensis TaxID=1763542 RepID=A0ABW0YUX0_9ACTN
MSNPPRIPDSAWRKSGYSHGNGGECLEVADRVPDLIPVRDSKRPGRATLFVPAPSWKDFLAALQDGAFGA